MQSLLKNLLGPIFYGMGVSEADFDSYLSMSMGYVYAILIALVLMIVVMVLARKAKKGTRGFIRLSSLVAFVAAIAVIANMLCFGPLRLAHSCKFICHFLRNILRNLIYKSIVLQCTT